MRYLVKLPFFIRRLFPRVKWRGDTGKRVIYLTFDDGPHPEASHRLLDLLEREKVPASFFLLGKNVERFPEIVERLCASGHLCGNHSYSHINGLDTDAETYLADIGRAARLIPSKYFRPPYGKMTLLQYHRLRKEREIVMWTVMPGDFDGKVDARLLLQRMLKHLRPGTIYVLHDKASCIDKLEEALPVFIRKAREKSYTFETVDF